MKKIMVALLLLVCWASLSWAQDPEPEIVIRQEEGRTIEEYRVNGQLFAIKVIPDQGEPYYLVDSEGDGELDQRERGRLLIPSWVILRW